MDSLQLATTALCPSELLDNLSNTEYNGKKKHIFSLEDAITKP